MAALPEDLAIEIEAMQHLFGEDAFTVSCRDEHTILTMPLVPRQVDGEHECYVAANLVLDVDNSSYPESPPLATLQDAKGLTDAACTAFIRQIQEESANLAGEMVLGHLCELALELMTAANHPSGTCAFCLEELISNSLATPSLASSSTATNYAYSILKLPCFHCFHLPCFTAWYEWQQAQQRTVLDPGLPGAELPRREDVECEGGWIARGVFAVRCPSCRFEVVPTTLRHALPQLLQKKGEKTSVCKAWESDHAVPRDVFTPEALKELRSMQRKFAQGLEAQRARNGLVQESVAVSIAELEAAAAEKRITMAQNSAPSEVAQGVARNNVEARPGAVPQKEKENKAVRAGERSLAAQELQGGRSGTGGGRGGRGGRGRGPSGSLHNHSNSNNTRSSNGQNMHPGRGRGRGSRGKKQGSTAEESPSG